MEGTAMSGSRDTFLERVRSAVKEGNRAGHAPPLPERGSTGYQGGGPDPAARFCDEWSAAGGIVHRVADAEIAISRVLELVQAKSARRALPGRGQVVEE